MNSKFYLSPSLWVFVLHSSPPSHTFYFFLHSWTWFGPVHIIPLYISFYSFVFFSFLFLSSFCCSLFNNLFLFILFYFFVSPFLPHTHSLPLPLSFSFSLRAMIVHLFLVLFNSGTCKYVDLVMRRMRVFVYAFQVYIYVA